MTNKVTVNETKNTVSVNKTTNQVTVEQGATQIVDVVTAGPAGPQGNAGSNFSLDDTNKVDKSIIYYDHSAATYKADSMTTSTITDGGNF